MFPRKPILPQVRTGMISQTTIPEPEKRGILVLSRRLYASGEEGEY